MEVIFLQDVPNVARAGEVKKVSDGFYRNYLLPNRLASPATPEMVKKLESEEQIKLKRKARLTSELDDIAQKLEGYKLEIPVKAGSQGRLYGAVTSADIAREIESKLGITVDKRKIGLEEPIKKTGTYDVQIRLAPEITSHLKVVLNEVSNDHA